MKFHTFGTVSLSCRAHFASGETAVIHGAPNKKDTVKRVESYRCVDDNLGLSAKGIGQKLVVGLTKLLKKRWFPLQEADVRRGNAREQPVVQKYSPQ